MDDLQNFSSVINTVFSGIQLDSGGKAHKILSSWEKVLLSIKAYNPNEGQNLVSHSRIVDLKNGVLLIEADHPGWIELLQMRKKYILKGMQMRAPELDIKTLAFRLKGNRGNLFAASSSAQDVRAERERMFAKLDQEEELLKNSNVNSQKTVNSNAVNTKKKPLPPELASIFADLKKSMLTNSE